MTRENNVSNEIRCKSFAEELWLNYFNNMLLAQGLITQDQHRKMAAKILCRKSSNG